MNILPPQDVSDWYFFGFVFFLVGSAAIMFFLWGMPSAKKKLETSAGPQLLLGFGYHKMEMWVGALFMFLAVVHFAVHFYSKQSVRFFDAVSWFGQFIMGALILFLNSNKGLHENGLLVRAYGLLIPWGDFVGYEDDGIDTIIFQSKQRRYFQSKWKFQVETEHFQEALKILELKKLPKLPCT